MKPSLGEDTAHPKVQPLATSLRLVVPEQGRWGQLGEVHFLAHTPRELVPLSPEMEEISSELGKLQAPEVLSGFPGKRVP